MRLHNRAMSNLAHEVDRLLCSGCCRSPGAASGQASCVISRAGQQPFVATCFVPQGASQPSEDRPSAAPVLDVKAVAQIAGSFSLT